MLFTALFQATISRGALVGSLVVDRTSPPTLIVLGAATALLMLLITSRVIDARRTHRAG